MALFDSDVPLERLKELAGHLKRFPVTEEEDPEQFWWMLACTLRKRNSNKCNYSELVCVDVCVCV